MGILKGLPFTLYIISARPGWGTLSQHSWLPQQGCARSTLAVIVFTQWWIGEEKLGKGGKGEEGKGERSNQKKKEKTEAWKSAAQPPITCSLFPITPSAKRRLPRIGAALLQLSMLTARCGLWWAPASG